MPRARSALTVCMQSSLGKKPWIVQIPFESAEIIAARWEMLLSPGTVISASIRGARFTRNSISPLKKRCCPSVSSIRHAPQLPLGNEKDFVCERILYFSARRKPTYIDQTLVGRVGTLHKTWFAGDWRAVRIVALGRL